MAVVTLRRAVILPTVQHPPPKATCTEALRPHLCAIGLHQPPCSTRHAGSRFGVGEKDELILSPPVVEEFPIGEVSHGS